MCTAFGSGPDRVHVIAKYSREGPAAFARLPNGGHAKILGILDEDGKPLRAYSWLKSGQLAKVLIAFAE